MIWLVAALFLIVYVIAWTPGDGFIMTVVRMGAALILAVILAVLLAPFLL
jgi:hypothetical protein